MALKKLKRTTELITGGITCYVACLLCLVILWTTWPVDRPAPDTLEALLSATAGIVALICFLIGTAVLWLGVRLLKKQKREGEKGN